MSKRRQRQRVQLGGSVHMKFRSRQDWAVVIEVRTRGPQERGEPAREHERTF